MAPKKRKAEDDTSSAIEDENVDEGLEEESIDENEEDIEMKMKKMMKRMKQ
ncbi:hypothetical protein Fmac_026714 [Flemingia macrophylla]|uniref:Uncharacterized protein n=1 Tax=Flemingia macrophylla TaxID=520843 RepID=A0ABD1LFM4_9FABA